MAKVIEETASFFRGMNRDLKVIILRLGVVHFIGNLNPYASVYAASLGATGTDLGILNSLSLAAVLASSILTGWISDRRDRKTIFLIGASMGALAPLAMVSAGSWLWLVPAFILSGVADGVAQPAFTTMYANSVRNERRGETYGYAAVFTLAPSLLAGVVGGAIVTHYGGLTVNGIRPLYILQAGLLAAIAVTVWKLLGREPQPPDARPLSLASMIQDYREVLGIKGARNWAFLKSLGSLSIGLAGPFWMLYAAQVKGASAMTMAYMVTARSLTNMLLSPFAGRLSDSVGRKKMIIGGRLVMYAGTALFLVSREDWTLVAAWILQGVNDSTGVAWQAEEVELVKPWQRARMTALSISSFNLLAVPASLLGGWLWDDVSPAAPFIVMAAIDGLVRMPIVYKYIPEGKEAANKKQP